MFGEEDEKLAVYTAFSNWLAIQAGPRLLRPITREAYCVEM